MAVGRLPIPLQINLLFRIPFLDKQIAQKKSYCHCSGRASACPLLKTGAKADNAEWMNAILDALAEVAVTEVCDLVGFRSIDLPGACTCFVLRFVTFADECGGRRVCKAMS